MLTSLYYSSWHESRLTKPLNLGHSLNALTLSLELKLKIS